MVVKETECLLYPYYNELAKLNSAVIIHKVKHNLASKCNFSFNCPNEDFLQPYKLVLIQNISLYYIKIKMFSISKTFSQILKMNVRNKLKKTVNFRNL